MHRPAPRSRHLALLGALTLAGCATVAPPVHRSESAYARFEWVRDSLEAIGAFGDGTRDDAAGKAPRVSLFIPPTGYTMVSYVDAGFRLTDDAYVLVLTVDRDRRVRVLYPESPNESGFTTQRAATHLTRFFGGFGSRTSAYASHDLSQRLSPFGAGGVLLAVASDRPLQLQRLADADGDWDARQLEQLVFERTMPVAAQSVARAVLLTGQEYSTDYLTYGGSRTLNAYRSYASALDECSPGNGLGYRFGVGAFDALGLRGYQSVEPFTRLVGFYQRDGRTYARYVSSGGCSTPVYYDVPTPRAVPVPAPADTIRRDTAATAGRWAHRLPRGVEGSFARVGAANGTASGGWTRAMSRTEPRVERHENARPMARVELRATVHRHEVPEKATPH